MEFSDPKRVIAAYDVGKVMAVLEEAEAAARGGLWAVGFVAYEAAPAFDPSLPVRGRDRHDTPADLPLAWFALFTDPMEAVPFVGETRLDTSPYTVSPWMPTMDEDQYDESVGRIRRLINAGDLTQVNYALHLDAAVSGDLFEFYRDLVLSQRGGNGAYLDLGRYRILSASPEQFFKIEGSRITIRPMKGAAARGRWADEDRRNAAKLLASERDRAEHQQIVDRMSEELETIAKPGTVESHALMDLQRFETVWQLVSEISADLDPPARIVDVFGALFPSAAVTGVPKARAMESIATLEGRPRGIYAGAIGSIAPSGGERPDASFSVAIRTVVVDTDEGIGDYGAGAGITASSAERGEYDEAEAKTRILANRRPEISLFETIRWEDDHGFRWLERHLRRLCESAAYFGFEYDEEVVRATLNASVAGRIGDHAVRIEVDRLGAFSVTVEAEELPDARWWPNPGLDPLVCEIDPGPISSTSVYRFHKTTARRPYSDRRDAHSGLDEVLLVNERGEITEGTTQNVAVQIAGGWVTPPLASGCLPGVLRSVLIDEGVLVEEVVMASDLNGVERMALLSSVHGWRPARLISR